MSLVGSSVGVRARRALHPPGGTTLPGPRLQCPEQEAGLRCVACRSASRCDACAVAGEPEFMTPTLGMRVDEQTGKCMKVRGAG